MKDRLQLIFLITIYFLYIPSTVAADIQVSIKGDKLSWISANSTSVGLVPSLWDIPVSLPPASQVILGGPSNISEQIINVSQQNGKSVSIPITVKGMQYRLSSYSNAESIDNGTSTAVVNGLENSVIGSGVSNVVIILSNLESPFTHYRPIIAPINIDNWLTAFKSAGATNGIYRGTIMISIPYDYYRNGIRIRNTLSLPVTITIDYVAQILNDVTVTGSNAMTTTYHYPLLISGETTYTINATGFFSNGVWVGLSPLTNGENYYSLRSLNPNNTDEIKYNVTCISGCDGTNNQIIINGVPQINSASTRAKILGTNTTQTSAKIRVDFDRVPIVSNDTYVGKFILMFEVDV
ncbi:hypothetical protein LDP52_01365 [Photobacterium damselae]|uniref:hypothetical protein n=1 Tax=Photobacterium damselae TaxID=38293 RepID=UPI002341A770|nr:hypothetical protein [Photobacterium damselae]MDC4167375.1 hypothetical protein [Photobacterium damselae]